MWILSRGEFHKKEIGFGKCESLKRKLTWYPTCPSYRNEVQQWQDQNENPNCSPVSCHALWTVITTVHRFNSGLGGLEKAYKGQASPSLQVVIHFPIVASQLQQTQQTPTKSSVHLGLESFTTTLRKLWRLTHALLVPHLSGGEFQEQPGRLLFLPFEVYFRCAD